MWDVLRGSGFPVRRRDPMRYPYVLFDVDGTLIDSSAAIDEGLADVALSVLGRPLSEGERRAAQGLPAGKALDACGIGGTEAHVRAWLDAIIARRADVAVFDGVLSMLDHLRALGATLALVTADTRYEFDHIFDSFGLTDRFDVVVCADDTRAHKPDPEPLQRCLNLLGAAPQEALYVGDGRGDAVAAQAAGIDFALACWKPRPLREPVRAAAYCLTPAQVVSFVSRERPLAEREPWLAWAQELQAIGQAGEHYTHDRFDLERFRRVRELASECASCLGGLPLVQVEGLFANEDGYKTPKMDSRAAIFDERGRICLVHEQGRWSLPGGWIDQDQTIMSNCVKEAREEAGLEVVPERLIAIEDQNLRNPSPIAGGCSKSFVLCRPVSGSFVENVETDGMGFFALDELPDLNERKNTVEQVRMCFEAHEAGGSWAPIVD